MRTKGLFPYRFTPPFSPPSRRAQPFFARFEEKPVKTVPKWGASRLHSHGILTLDIVLSKDDPP
jgi:hypothetical protein